MEGRLHKNEFMNTQIPLFKSNKIDFFPTLYSLGIEIEIEIHGIIVGTVTQIGSYGYIQFSNPRATRDSQSNSVINVPSNDIGYDIPILEIHEIDFILKITLDHASMSFKNSSGSISEYSYSCFELVTTPLRYRQPPQAVVNRMKRMIALTTEIISSTADTFLSSNQYLRMTDLENELVKYFGHQRVHWPEGSFGKDHPTQANKNKKAVAQSLFFCPLRGIYRQLEEAKQGLVYTQLNFTIPIEKIAYLNQEELSFLFEGQNETAKAAQENFHTSQHIGVALCKEIFGEPEPPGISGLFSLVFMMLFIRMKDFYSQTLGIPMNKNLLIFLNKYNLVNVLRFSLSDNDKRTVYKKLIVKANREKLKSSIVELFKIGFSHLTYISDKIKNGMDSYFNNHFTQISHHDFSIDRYCTDMVEFIFAPKRRESPEDAAYVPNDNKEGTYAKQSLLLRGHSKSELERIIALSQLVPKEYSIQKQIDAKPESPRRGVLFETRDHPSKYVDFSNRTSGGISTKTYGYKIS